MHPRIRVLPARSSPGHLVLCAGISLKGGLSADGEDLGIYVESLAHGGSASADGRIRPGDRIIEAGGINLVERTNNEAMSRFRAATLAPEINLTVARREAPATPVPGVAGRLEPPLSAASSTAVGSPVPPSDRAREIDLAITPSGLDIAIELVDRWPTIVQIPAGGNAALDGRLKTGDVRMPRR